MTNKLEILILDDNEDSASRNEQRIKDACESVGVNVSVRYMDAARKSALIAAIERFGADGVSSEPHAPIGSLTDLDGVDVLFIDYQLKTLKDHAWLTAEDLAGWIRAYSEVPAIGILNRFFDVDFDLSMQIATSLTSSDFHLNDRLLDLAALWQEPTGAVPVKSSFHPWSWPLVPRLVTDIRQCRDELEAVDLSQPILPWLGFSDQDIPQLTIHALGFLDPTSTSPGGATFQQFFTEGRIAISKELRAGLIAALDQGDEAIRIEVRRIIARVLVSELRRWLSTLVLTTQDVLIDAPHLGHRMPWTVREPENQDKWQWLANHRYSESLVEQVSPHRFEKQHWVSRPVYWVSKVQGDEVIDGLYRDFPAPEKNFVFVEDFSCFVEQELADAFQPAFESVWPTRYVLAESVMSWGYKYAPKVRLI